MADLRADFSFDLSEKYLKQRNETKYAELSAFIMSNEYILHRVSESRLYDRQIVLRLDAMLTQGCSRAC